MLQLRDGLRPRPEARPLDRVRMAGGEHLEGDGALQRQVPGLVHDAHAALSEHRLHLVAGDLWQADGGGMGAIVSATGGSPSPGSNVRP
jgi:hypothetical protein